MGKISPVSSKYIIYATIVTEGVVEKPDVIGAIFGQTEGLLGNELELRELQRSGRIGRIEVNLETKGGKTEGQIIIPSSLDKAETVIIGASLETIQRIGPCNAKVVIGKVEDVRVSKRSYVIERAKELLRKLTDEVLPDSQEITDEVAYSVRMMEIKEYGKDRLPAGPAIDESEEILVVEGRADVLNLLKHGFKNAIAMNGTSLPQTIIDICRQKTVTVFVDGDRGGDLIVRDICNETDVDYVAKAPDGKEVEEITKKEIHKALRGRVAVEQAKLDPGSTESSKPAIDTKRTNERRMGTDKKYGGPERRIPQYSNDRRTYTPRPMQSRPVVVKKISENLRKDFSAKLDDLVGTRGAYILDEKLAILGKVPTIELVGTIKNLGSGMFAVVFDGSINKEIVDVAEKTGIKYIVGMESAEKFNSFKTQILTKADLQ